MAFVTTDGNFPDGQRGIHRVLGLDLGDGPGVGRIAHRGIADVLGFAAEDLAAVGQFIFDLAGIQIQGVEFGAQGVRHAFRSDRGIAGGLGRRLFITCLGLGMFPGFFLDVPKSQSAENYS